MMQAESATPGMSLYLVYDSYLTARQLGLIIESIDDVHSTLSYGADYRREEVTFPDRARLRIERVDTGRSIEVLFQAGQEMAAELLGPGSVVVGGAGVVAATATLLVKAFSRLRIERQRAQLGEVAVDAERDRLEIFRRGAALEIRREELVLAAHEVLVRIAADQALLGQRTPEQVVELAKDVARPMSALYYQLNSGSLIKAALDGQDLVEPRPPAEPQTSS